MMVDEQVWESDHAKTSEALHGRQREAFPIKLAFIPEIHPEYCGVALTLDIGFLKCGGNDYVPRLNGI